MYGNRRRVLLAQVGGSNSRAYIIKLIHLSESAHFKGSNILRSNKLGTPQESCRIRTVRPRIWSLPRRPNPPFLLPGFEASGISFGKFSQDRHCERIVNTYSCVDVPITGSGCCSFRPPRGRHAI